MLKVSARAPTRVDLAGGTLDIHPLTHLIDRPLTVNVGISVYTFAEIRVGERLGELSVRSVDQNLYISGTFQEVVASKKLPLLTRIVDNLWSSQLPGLSIECSSESPAGAGLGGSSSLAVSLVGALSFLRAKLGYGVQFSEYDLVRFVGDLESRIIHCPTGTQDYWGALRGGLNIMRFPYGGPEIKTFRSESMAWLKDRMLLVYSGVSRASGINNWNIFKAAFDGDTDLIKKLSDIARVSRLVADAIYSGQSGEAISLMREEWHMRRSLWPAIETRETKAIDEACVSAGADFTKVCGAGGGGVMAVFCQPELRDAVSQAAQNAGGIIMPSTIDDEGLVVKDILEKGL